mmetsp:Transcript_18281/g.51757  ORF Transcript_18281/g.51757 Transcript_18281/m.51757 type:complete len:284 (-) Transcript_18281:215-1066(-)
MFFVSSCCFSSLCSFVSCQWARSASSNSCLAALRFACHLSGRPFSLSSKSTACLACKASCSRCSCSRSPRFASVSSLSRLRSSSMATDAASVSLWSPSTEVQSSWVCRAALRVKPQIFRLSRMSAARTQSDRCSAVSTALDRIAWRSSSGTGRAAPSSEARFWTTQRDSTSVAASVSQAAGTGAGTTSVLSSPPAASRAACRACSPESARSSRHTAAREACASDKPACAAVTAACAARSESTFLSHRANSRSKLSRSLLHCACVPCASSLTERICSDRAWTAW